jgi:hypothetical protein
MKVRTIVLCSLFFGCSGRSSARPPAPTSASESQPVEDPAALKAIDEGERTIAVAGGDCAQSCGALARITSARVKLCSPRTSACPDAERREDEARRTVASYCGKCP